jgi:hypothetical protein
MRHMNVARIYNSKVGSSITHNDVAEWGMVETLRIMSALEFMDQT